MTAPLLRTVESSEWAHAIDRLSDEGFTMVDLVTAIDRVDRLEIVAVVAHPESGQRIMLSSAVSADAPQIASATATLPGAAWHERETAEMFGIHFVGHPDPRPLLMRSAEPDPGAPPPLRKVAALLPRVETTWPGAVTADDGRRARRPQLPPGVRSEWLPGRAEG